MCFYTTLLGFIVALFNWQYFFKELLNRYAIPTFELDVHILTFSFANDQYTHFTDQKRATYAGQSSGTAEILSQGLKF